MTTRDFRHLALGFPAATENAHMSHPDFRIAGKIFATLGYPDAKWAMVKLTPEQQAEFVHAEPCVFIPVKGGWGRKGDRLLIEAAQKDPARFVDLYEQNFERVYAFIARRVRERADAEDLTAEVFHHALANLKKFEWRGAPFSAWLFRIASNAVADRWQRAARERGDPDLDDPPDPRGAIGLEDIEKRARLFRLVADLPDDQRSVIESRFAAGKSIAEIARELGRSDGAVKQLQFRAIRTLRTRWEPKVRRKTSGIHG